MHRLPLIALLFLLCFQSNAQERPQADQSTVQIVRALTDPTKLDKLKGPRAANERLRKIAYHLHVSEEPGHVVVLAIRPTPCGILARQALLRNLKILRALGCTTDANLAL